jgi:hypothetical protein
VPQSVCEAYGALEARRPGDVPKMVRWKEWSITDAKNPSNTQPSSTGGLKSFRPCGQHGKAMQDGDVETCKKSPILWPSPANFLNS